MNKIILYIRVSTREQQDKGFSLQTQERLLRDYFKDYTVLEVVHDTTSGMKLEREGLQYLLKRLNTTNYIGVLDEDRLSRDIKVMGVIEYFCNLNNVKILYANERNKEGNQFISEITSVVAKKENIDRLDRIRRTKDTCFLNGRHVAKPPLGYKYNKDVKPSKLVTTQAIFMVKEIFKKRQQGLGYLKIAKELPVKNKKDEYAPMTVKAILHNPFYCGYIIYKKEIRKGIHEAIISKEEFLKIRGNEKWDLID